MDTSALSASKYDYLTTLAGSGPQAAVVQALAGAYAATAAATAPSSDDPLAAVAGASALGPLVSGITALTGGDGIQQATFAPSFGGLDASSATSLLASLGSSSDGGLDGFGPALSAGANLAATAYLAQKTYGSGPSAATAGLAAAQGVAADGASTLDLLA